MVSEYEQHLGWDVLFRTLLALQHDEYNCMMDYTDLLGRMSVEQKISQLGNSAAALDNLTIPAYQW